MTQQSELLSCPNPWCEEGVYLVERREGGFYRVGCTCGVASPASASEEEAIKLWNTRAAFEVMARSDGWLPIEDAPRTEFIHSVLIARDHGNRCVMPAYFDGENWRTHGIAGPMVFVEPTHWRPLPDPPSSIRELPHD